MTIASRLTASGRSAVAVIGLRGDDAAACVLACFRPARHRDFAAGQIRYGVWSAVGDEQGISNGESIVITPLASDEFEIHAHGGSAAVTQILKSLTTRGVTVVDASDFASKDVHNTLQLEAEAVLAGCQTTLNAAIALDQSRAGLSVWVRDQLAAPTDLESLQDSVRRILQWESLGQHLVEPYRVVLAGPPNVGKSSLINRIVGYGRAITHDSPGTTRDVIDCETVLDGVAIRLSDTAGIREGGGEIEREGIRRGAIAIGDADLVVLVVSPFCLGDLSRIRLKMNAIAPETQAIEVLNQADRLNEIDLPPGAESPSILTCALEPSAEIGSGAANDGIEQLMKAIIANLRPNGPPMGHPIPLGSRQSKWLREIVHCSQIQDAVTCLRSLKDGKF